MSDDRDPKVTIEDIDDAEKAARYYSPLLLLRGVVGILAGIVLLFWPTAGLAVVAVSIGLFLLVDGIERLVSVLRHPGRKGKTDFLALGGAFLRILFGVIVTLNPVGTGGFWVSLVFIIAGLNLISGSLLLFWKDPGMKNEPLSAGMAILMLLLGLMMIILPMFSALFLFRILGGILVLAAVPSLALGLRSR